MGDLDTEKPIQRSNVFDMKSLFQFWFELFDSCAFWYNKKDIVNIDYNKGMLFGSVSINVRVSLEELVIQFRQEVGKSLILKLQRLLKTIQGSEEKTDPVFFSWFLESMWLFDVYFVVIFNSGIEESRVYVNLFGF